MFLTKYCASGNDFVIFHHFKSKDRANLTQKLCDRNYGIGADGLVVLLPDDTHDFKWEFYNSDGSDAAMCGNASRAVAHYAYNHGLADAKMSFATGAGTITATVDGDIVESELTKPIIIKEPFTEEGFEWWIVDTGVPHAVALVDDLSLYNKEIAAKIRYKYNTNVNFAKIEDGVLKVRTYERGVEDETQACGTGMAASFLRAYNLGLIGDSSNVYPTSNEELSIRLEDNRLFFKGSVFKVLETTYTE
jgi:diaminopimelate epimerase